MVLAFAGWAWANDFSQAPLLPDADAYVESAGWSTENQTQNFGGAPLVHTGYGDWMRKSYLHFSLAVEHPALRVTSATLRMVCQPDYLGGQTGFYAVMDPAKDWDLTALPENAIDYTNAPQNQAGAGLTGYELPGFMEMGSGYDAVTRLLGSVPNDVDVVFDVTDVVKWAMGKKADYSSFTASGGELTVCFRELAEYDYSGYRSKEYTPADASDAPRIEITQFLQGGDANYDDKVDYLDLGALAASYRGTGGWEQGDFTGDGNIDYLDLGVLAGNYRYDGTALPEPATLSLLMLAGLALLRRR